MCLFRVNKSGKLGKRERRENLEVRASVGEGGTAWKRLEKRLAVLR